MPEVKGCDQLFSSIPKKRFGVFCKFGTSQAGFSNFGDDDLYIFGSGFGTSAFGKSPYSDIIILSGIYKKQRLTNATKNYRVNYYISKNPRSVSQQANRQKYASAVSAWQALTEVQKIVYNKRTKGKSLSGYNLFLSEYLLSN